MREAVFEILDEAGGSGKTVFHSSHVLTEVDRTCTRVGIVRSGRLLKVLSIDEIRHTSARRMVVHFVGPAPLDELDLAGVELLERDHERVVLRVSGQLDPLLGVLARHPLRDLTFPESSLEETFVEFYRSDRPEEK